MTETVIYTDGSALPTGSPGGIAFVAEVGGMLVESALELRATTTNQRAEILAAAYALDQIDPCAHAVVYSDSEYLVKGMSQWMENWQRRGWRTKRGGKPVKNRQHWERLLLAVARHERVEFRWCRGHNGEERNERAHQLAYDARMRATEP